MQQWKQEREPCNWGVEERETTGTLRQERPGHTREARRRPPSRGPFRWPGTRWCVLHSDSKAALNGREMREDTPKLDHPGRGEKEELAELVKHTPQGRSPEGQECGCRPQEKDVSERRQSAAVSGRTEQSGGARWHRTEQRGKGQNETVKYVPRGRDQRGTEQKNWAGQRYATACAEAGTKTPVETAGDGPQTRCTAHAGRTGQNAASAAGGAQVEESDGSKARDTTPCAAEQCPTRQSRSPARHQQPPPRPCHRPRKGLGGQGCRGCGFTWNKCRRPHFCCPPRQRTRRHPP